MWIDEFKPFNTVSTHDPMQTADLNLSSQDIKMRNGLSDVALWFFEV